MADRLITPEDAGIKLHIKPPTLQWWRSMGRGPKYVKIGRRIFYWDSVLDDYIAAGERTPGQA